MRHTCTHGAVKRNDTTRVTRAHTDRTQLKLLFVAGRRQLNKGSLRKGKEGTSRVWKAAYSDPLPTNAEENTVW